MTIVTSLYHQRWGQAVYNALAELYRQQHGYSVEILGNYSCDLMPDVPAYRNDDQIAVRQIAGILELPRDALQDLPTAKTPVQPEEEAPAEDAALPEEEELPEDLPEDEALPLTEESAAEESLFAEDVAPEEAEAFADPELPEFIGSDELLPAA